MIKKTRVAPRNGLIAALDIGTTKMCCFIARVAEDGRPSIVGIGHQISRGVRSGAIIDMEQAELAIRTTVHAAEQMAGETIQRSRRQPLRRLSGLADRRGRGRRSPAARSATATCAGS